MDSDEKKMRAGSGGGPTARKDIDPHGDVRFVDGIFYRQADDINLLVHSAKTESTNLCLGAVGEDALIQLTAERMVLIETRQPGDPTGDLISTGLTGDVDIIVSATKGGDILLQRGRYDDNHNQNIRLSEDYILIDSGTSGRLILQAGTSRIELTPTSITIQAGTVNINPY